MEMTDVLKFEFGQDPYRGLGRKVPHLMPMLGGWVCFALTPRGKIISAGSGRTIVAAFASMMQNR
jgi:hypothetical protein